MSDFFFLAYSSFTVLVTIGLLVWRLRDEAKDPFGFEIVRIKSGRFAIRHITNRHWWLHVRPAYDLNLDGSLGWGDKMYRLTYASFADAMEDYALYRRGGYITGKEVRGR